MLDIRAVRLLLLRPGACLAEGFSPDLFYAPYSAVVAYVVGFYRQYNIAPPRSDIQDKFPDLYEDILRCKPIDKPEYYAAELRGRSRHNTFQALLARLEENAQEEGVGTDDLIRMVYDETRKIMSMFRVDDGVLIGDATEEISAIYDEMAAGDGRGFPVPFAHIDAALLGLRKGKMTAVAGRPTTGKSWFLVLCAVCALAKSARLPPDVDAVAASDTKVLFVSFEMPPVDIGRRIISTIAGLSGERVDKGVLLPDEHTRFLNVMAALRAGGPKLKIVGRSIRSVLDIDAAIDKFKADIVMVDAYYYLIRSSTEKASRHEKLATAVAELNHLKLTHNIPVLVASQLNREGDLAGTDTLLQDADNVIRLRRDARLEKQGFIDISLQKGREALAGSCRRYVFDIDGAFTLRDIGPGQDADAGFKKKTVI